MKPTDDDMKRDLAADLSTRLAGRLEELNASRRREEELARGLARADLNLARLREAAGRALDALSTAFDDPGPGDYMTIHKSAIDQASALLREVAAPPR